MEISFQRAIKINSRTNGSFSQYDHKVDPAINAVIETIRSSNSSVYDRETSRKIGEFLRTQLGDYNRNTGLYARRIRNNVYIFTGEEAKKAKEINTNARKEIEKIEEEYLNDPVSKKIGYDGGKIVYKGLKRDILCKRDDEMLKLVENGRDDKPETKINFEMDKEGKIQKITYESYKHDGRNYSKDEAQLTI